MIMSRQRKQNKGQKQTVAKLDSLKQIKLNAAGLDIGAAEIWVCVPEDRDEVSVRCFETFTVDLHALADWLEGCGIETVAMESTGVYWIPIYEILEARGFEVYLVNARHMQNAKRPTFWIVNGSNNYIPMGCCKLLFDPMSKLVPYGLLFGSEKP